MYLQALLSALSLTGLIPWTSAPPPPPRKSIAIVGAGSGGLAALKVVLDVQRELGLDWDVVLYEQRRAVGGVWLEDPNPPRPPILPETPLYPALRTNTPHPTMTYLNFTFPPNTSLYPAHEHLQRYHASYATYNDLYPYINLHHEVKRTEWVGNSTHGHWSVRVRRGSSSRVGLTFERTFDHLIVASGHNHYPRIPAWPGQGEWLAANKDREIQHSIFWRGPQKHAGKTIIVVGISASGRDVALHTTPVARKLYHSVSTHKQNQVEGSAIPKPRISHFTRDAIYFENGSSVTDVDAIVLATGYEVRVPFLTFGNALQVDPFAKSSNASSENIQLTTNTRYIRPLYRQVLSLSTAFPTTALYFIGLPVAISNAPSDIAQALFVAHTIANPSLLPSRLDLLHELEESEEELRQAGYDPDVLGHTLVDLSGRGESRSVYQDEIVEFLNVRGVPGLPLRGSGGRFVDDWRRHVGRGITANSTLASPLRQAWARVEALGEEEVAKWLKGRTTEEDWAQLMAELVEWEEQQE